jgi:hypothetical protein
VKITRLAVLVLVALGLALGAASSEARVFKVISNLINDTITVACPLDTGDPAVGAAGYAFTAESTAIVDVGDFPNIGMFLRVIPAGGDTSTRIRLAVQVRAHLDFTGDSSSTFPWVLWNGQANATNPDTVRNTFTTYNPPAGEGCGVWAGEFVVSMQDPVRGRGTMRSNEFFGAPNGLYIPLTSRTGPRFTAPYMSIRVRVLEGASKPKVVLHLGLVQ